MKKNNKLCLSVLLCVLFVALVALAACNNTTYTLTYVTNGGDVIESVEFKEGDSVTPPTATKQYFTFDGWYADAELTAEFTEFNNMPDHDVTVYAKWIAGESGRIIFKTNGGSAVEDVIGVVGQSIPTIEAPTKDGYIFAGWYKDVELTQPAVLGTFTAGTLTLYAKWNKDTANYAFVTYVLNGVDNEVPVLSGTKATEPKPATDADVDCVWYTDAEFTKRYDFNSNVTQDIKLYGLMQSKGLTFDGATVTGYTGSNEQVYIPAKANGQTITTIGDGAFEGNLTLKYVVLPETVSEIAEYAFYHCEYLVNINVTEHISSISKYAFAGCERLVTDMDLSSLSVVEEATFSNCYWLTRVIFTDNLTSIGVNAFSNCTDLTDVVLPDSVETIGNYAFANSGLTSFAIPSSLVTLGKGAFKGCAITSVTGGNSNFVVDSATGTLTNGTTLVQYFTTEANGSMDHYTLPAGITAVAPYAFYGNTSIKHLDVSANNEALGLSSLEGIVNLETLKVKDFNQSNPYLAYWFGASVANTASGVLIPTSLTTVEFTNFATTALVDYAFYGARGLDTVIGMNGVTSIGDYAFGYTALTSFNVSSSVTELSNTAFRGVKTLSEITVDTSNTVFSSYDGALYNKAGTTLIYVPEAKTELSFTSTVSEIADSAMFGSRVTELTVPDSIVSIGYGAFESMTRLATLTVPFIGGSADSNTYMLYVFGATVSTEEDHIVVTDAKCPSSLKSITITKHVTAIPDNAFLLCTSVSEINVAGEYTSIGTSAYESTGLNKIVVPDSVTTIGDYAFYACEKVTSVVVGKGATSIGEWAFANLTELESIVFEEGANDLAIGNNAFYATVEQYSYEIDIYSHVARITFSNNIVSIGDEAFAFVGLYGSLDVDETYTYLNITFDVANSRLKTIGDSAFVASGISSVVLPASIETIGEGAFAGSYVLKSATIGSSDHEATNLTYIGDGAFAENPLMTSFTLYKSVTNRNNVPTLGSANGVFTYSVVINNQQYLVCPMYIYVPANSVMYYQIAWSEFEDFIFAI